MAREDTVIRFGAIDQLSPTIDKIAGKLGGLNSALVGVATGATAAVAAGTARAISNFDRIGDAAARLNITAEALSGLGFAAAQSGSSAATLEKGLGRLSKAIGDAAGGNREAIALFERLGVTFLDASGQARAADAVLLDVADALKGTADGATKASLAQAAFGRGLGQELIPLLNEGSDGIRRLTEEAREFGAIIGTDAVRDAQEFKDNLDKLTVAGKSFFNGLATEILPTLVQFSGASADAARETGGLAQAGEGLGRFINLGVTGFAALSGSVQLYANGLQQIAALTAGDFAGFQKLRADAAALGADLKPRLDALVDGTFKLDKSMASAGASIKGTKDFTIGLGGAVIKLTPDVVKAGKAAEDAAKKQTALSKAQADAERTAKALAKAQDDLALSLRKAFEAGLKPATEATQEFSAVTGELVRTSIPDIEVAITRASDAFEGFGDVQSEEAQFFQENWEGAVDAVYDSLTDLIVNGLDDFDDFGKSLQSIAKQFLGNIVKQFLSTNLNFGGTNFGSLFGGGGGGRGGAGGGLNFGGPGASLGTRVGLGATGVAIAYDGYQSGNALQGAAGGALAGFQVAGPVGAIVGALLGGLAAALNRQKPPSINVIGDDVVGTPGFRNLAPGSTFESRLGGFSFASIDSVDAQTRNQIGQSVVNFDNEIAKLLNEDQLAAVTDALAGFNIRLKDGAISAENILGERFNAILSTFDQATQDFVNGAATLEERTQRLADVLSRPQRLSALLDSLEEADRLAGMTPFEQALDRINKEFDAAAKAAEELGADQAQLARVEELRGNAIQRLNDLQRENLDALLDDLVFEDATEGLSDSDREIAAINRRFDRLREQAIALGATQEDLELIERRRTAALRQQAQATRDSTDAIIDFARAIEDDLQVVRDYQQDFLSSLRDASAGVRQYLQRGSATNSLNPLQALQQSQAQFEELARLASVGDVGAIRNITGGADRLLQQAASFYGVGSADFQRIEALVRGTLAPIAGAGDQQSVALALAQLRQVMTELLRFLNGGGAGGGGVMSASQLNQLLVGIDRLGREPARAL